jgi:hypothetical protein
MLSFREDDATMARLCYILGIVLAGCDAGGLIITETRDADPNVVLEHIDASPDAEEAMSLLDGSLLCNGNGGIVCIEDTDCPDAKGCPYFFRCEFVDGQDAKRCLAYPLDGGAP